MENYAAFNNNLFRTFIIFLDDVGVVKDCFCVFPFPSSCQQCNLYAKLDTLDIPWTSHVNAKTSFPTLFLSRSSIAWSHCFVRSASIFLHGGSKTMDGLLVILADQVWAGWSRFNQVIHLLVFVAYYQQLFLWGSYILEYVYKKYSPMLVSVIMFIFSEPNGSS